MVGSHGQYPSHHLFWYIARPQPPLCHPETPSGQDPTMRKPRWWADWPRCRDSAISPSHTSQGLTSLVLRWGTVAVSRTTDDLVSLILEDPLVTGYVQSNQSCVLANVEKIYRSCLLLKLKGYCVSFGQSQRHYICQNLVP